MIIQEINKKYSEIWKVVPAGRTRGPKFRANSPDLVAYARLDLGYWSPSWYMASFLGAKGILDYKYCTKGTETEDQGL